MDIPSNCPRVRELFAENFESGAELGASLCVYQNGELILNLASGFCDREQTVPWTESTPVLVWSATKGLAAACFLHLCEQRRIPLAARVIEFWPEFAVAGKDEVTLGEVLSHRAGLAALCEKPPVLDHDAVVAALAAQTPNWPRGTAHGYHPRTFGFLLDELIRRITGGITLGEYWRETFALPLALDFWIGAPATLEIAPVFPAKSAPPKGDPFYTAFMTSRSMTARAFSSPSGLHSAGAMNTPEARTASLPAFGGIGTAAALAKFYAMLAQGGCWQGSSYFAPATLELMSRTLSQQHDQVLQMETAFSAGFMRDPLDAEGKKLRTTFGPSPRAFGHPGAGGSHSFADPDNGIGFAYVMNQMETGVLPNRKSLRLVDALYNSGVGS